MAFVMPLPYVTTGMVLAMLLCCALAVWVARQDLAIGGLSSTTSTRIVAGMIIALLLSVPLLAQPVYAPCDWDTLMDQCGASKACAWGMWWINGCPLR